MRFFVHKPFTFDVLTREHNLAIIDQYAKTILWYHINIIAPEIAISKLDHRDRFDCIQLKEIRICGDTCFFIRFSLGSLKWGFVIFAATRYRLPVSRISPFQEGVFESAIVDSAVWINQHLKWSSCHL